VNPHAVFQCAELLELLGLLERRRRPSGELQQAAYSVGVDADVPPRAGKARGPAGRDAVARPGNGGAAEVQRLAVARAQRLHAAGVEKFRQ